MSGDRSPVSLAVRAIPVLIVCAFMSAVVCAQDQLLPDVPEPTRPSPAGPPAPAKVDVQPEARDPEIQDRLRRIMEATGWFDSVRVRVKDGVVFLDGKTSDEQYKEWGGTLARNTQDVAAVVNRMEVATPSVWDFSAAQVELGRMTNATLRAIPILFLGVVVLAIAWLVARITSRGMRRFLRNRVPVVLLREVAARAIAILIFVLGLYFVLRLAGLTRLAISVLGGTGLLGLIIGIAFRDITENFLASIFLSLQRPFREGDLVDIAGTLGFVQRLTSRTTILMSLDGNHVQVPNSVVYKNSIRNFTSNPNRREDFLVGISYDTPIAEAQSVALRVLAEHAAVLADPPPWVLVDSLGGSTVNLRIYFWLDGSQHSWLKVRSSVIRLVKRAFQDANIELPDDAREVLFPRGVPVQIIERTSTRSENGPSDGAPTPPVRTPSAPSPPVEETATPAEGDLETDARQIREQAKKSWFPERDENLLPASQSEE